MVMMTTTTTAMMMSGQVPSGWCVHRGSPRVYVSLSLGEALIPCLALGAALDIMSPASAATASDSSTATVAAVAEEEFESPREEVSVHVVAGGGSGRFARRGRSRSAPIISVSNIVDIIRGLGHNRAAVIRLQRAIGAFRWICDALIAPNCNCALGLPLFLSLGFVFDVVFSKLRFRNAPGECTHVSWGMRRIGEEFESPATVTRRHFSIFFSISPTFPSILDKPLLW